MTDAFDKLDALVKGMARGGKYFRRVPTGNPKRPWRYFYTKEAYEKEHGDNAHRDGATEKQYRDGERRADVTGTVAGRKLKLKDGVYYRAAVMSNEDNDHLWNVVFTPRKTTPGLAAVDQLPIQVKGLSYEASTKLLNEFNEPDGGFGRRWRGDAKTNLRDVGLDTLLSKPLSEARDLLLEGYELEVRASGVGDRNSQAEKIRRKLMMSHADIMQTLLDRKKGKTHTEKSMNIPRSAQLSKGLYSFVFDERDKQQGEIKDAWLPDYVDAFIEEAFEHERSERAHQDPQLLPAGEDPASSMVNAIYNEFIAYCAKNKTLARAKDKIPVTREYIGARLQARGISHVQSENLTADQEAQVAGYHPQPLQLSRDAFAAAEQERDEAVRRMGSLVKGEEHVVLGDDENPMHAFAKSTEASAARLHNIYGRTGAVPTHDPECLFHGRDLLKAGLEQAVVHGAVCTCGR